MDHGPVLSTTYDLIKGSGAASPEWNRFFNSDGRDVLLAADPGVGKLTRYEIRKLQDVAQRFVAEDNYAVADYTHTFAEWIKNRQAKGSKRDIPADDLLDATGLSPINDQLIRDFGIDREIVNRSG